MVMAMNSASGTRRIAASRGELGATADVSARKLYRWLRDRAAIAWRRSGEWPEVAHR
jgi:hypothetical protein